MQTGFDDNSLDCWKLPKANYIVKFRKNDGLVADIHIKITLRSQLGAFILTNNWRIISIFLIEINGFYNKSIYYKDTDSLYVEKNVGMAWRKAV